MSHVGGCSIPGLSTCSVALYCSLLYPEVPSGSRLADLANSTLFVFHLTLFTAARERASLNPHLRYTDTRVKATRIPLPPSQGAASLVQCWRHISLSSHVLRWAPCPSWWRWHSWFYWLGKSPWCVSVLKNSCSSFRTLKDAISRNNLNQHRAGMLFPM